VKINKIFKFFFYKPHKVKVYVCILGNVLQSFCVHFIIRSYFDWIWCIW